MIKNATLLYLNALSGFIFAVLMILKFGLSFVPGIFLMWPVLVLILIYLYERRKLNDYNRHVHYTVDGNEQVNSIGVIILNLVAFLTLYFVPTLQLDSWELVIAYIPLAIFLSALIVYYGRLGRMLAQNRFSQSVSDEMEQQ